MASLDGDPTATGSDMPEEPVYRITLVRHCESFGNAEARIQGHVDYPLSERGRAQAAALARRWQNETIAFDHVIASPLARARDTARIIAAPLGFPEPECDPLWIEQDMGAHAGTRFEDLSERRCQTAFEDPDATTVAASRESDEALSLRARQALQSILNRPPARFLVVSHRAILTTIVYAILGIESRAITQPRPRFRLPNASISRFRFFPRTGGWQADVIGDRSHWSANG
jgi:broad specificity phosphatase PhoE